MCWWPRDRLRLRRSEPPPSTDALAEADADLAALGQGNPPRAGTRPGVDQAAEPGVADWPAAAAGVAVVVVLSALWVWVRRRRLAD